MTKCLIPLWFSMTPAPVDTQSSRGTHKHIPPPKHLNVTCCRSLALMLFHIAAWQGPCVGVPKCPLFPGGYEQMCICTWLKKKERNRIDVSAMSEIWACAGLIRHTEPRGDMQGSALFNKCHISLKTLETQSQNCFFPWQSLHISVACVLSLFHKSTVEIDSVCSQRCGIPVCLSC